MAKNTKIGYVANGIFIGMRSQFRCNESDGWYRLVDVFNKQLRPVSTLPKPDLKFIVNGDSIFPYNYGDYISAL
ncbi:hypothetical protein D6827_02810, partial [Candidatus Parcubacteria bacterium]